MKKLSVVKLLSYFENHCIFIGFFGSRKLGNVLGGFEMLEVNLQRGNSFRNFDKTLICCPKKKTNYFAVPWAYNNPVVEFVRKKELYKNKIYTLNEKKTVE